jgi:hypothetical protein
LATGSGSIVFFLLYTAFERALGRVAGYSLSPGQKASLKNPEVKSQTMSGQEVLGCVARIVSTFSQAADTLAIVKERKEKKKKKKDKEVEELVEIKLLHKSLTEVRMSAIRSCFGCSYLMR